MPACNHLATCLLLAAAAVASFAAPAGAATFNDPEGQSGTGVNDTLATATPLGVLPVDVDSLTVGGFISDVDANDVDFYQFTVAGGPLGVFFDVDLAEDINATDDDDVGLDAQVSIFDAAGTLIANNDDSDFFETGGNNAGTDPGSDSFADHDPFIGELTLGNGTYYAVVSYYSNDPNAFDQDNLTSTSLSFSGDLIDGATPDSTFELDQDPPDADEQNFGTYRLDIRTQFSEVPEPTTLGLLGVGGLGLLARRRRD